MGRTDYAFVEKACERFTKVNLGGTAIGTGIAADEKFSQVVVEELRHVTGLPMVIADDLIEASSNVGSMLYFSGILRRVAVKISKICNDLRLLSSGPRCGFGEIRLPAMAPGSSIMPGKVNPIIPELMNMCAFQVIGNDFTIVMGSEGGQLELNVFEPVIIYNLFQSIDMLTRGMDTLRLKCIDGIEANEQHCKDMVFNSIGIVTALLPHIGYKRATESAKAALDENKSVGQVVVEKGFLEEDQVKELLDPIKMTRSTNKRQRVR